MPLQTLLLVVWCASGANHGSHAGSPGPQRAKPFLNSQNMGLSRSLFDGKILQHLSEIGLVFSTYLCLLFLNTNTERTKCGHGGGWRMFKTLIFRVPCNRRCDTEGPRRVHNSVFRIRAKHKQAQLQIVCSCCESQSSRKDAKVFVQSGNFDPEPGLSGQLQK